MHKQKSGLPSTLLVLLAAVPLMAGCQEVRPGLIPVTIHTADQTVAYEVEVAATRNQKRRGLMYRKHLPADRGMLFIYKPEQVATMWMKNTHLPLDMLFIDAVGRIVRIEENTEPVSTRIISSEEKIRAVLELNGGQAAEHDIEAGDKVVW